MKCPLILALPLLLMTASFTRAQEEAAENMCVVCHGDPEMWEEEQKHLRVGESHLARDVHWQKGLRCHDCHGGNPAEEDFVGAHDEAAGFRKITTPADVPGFCGRCHSDVNYMRRFQPSARTDQESEFWTSGHGKTLRKDPRAPVATCTSCHGHHGIRATKDLESPVYPTRVAETCATCHADAEKMKPFSHNGRPLGHDQYRQWKGSVHGHALLEKGDLYAPTCNDCHGNHGALPPEVGSVANACGSCHGRISELFNETRMRHRFEEIGLPGCAACHGHHDISQPDDEMLGMSEMTVCDECHRDHRHGATSTGAAVATMMRDSLESLKAEIEVASERVATAERLGMEVRRAHFELQEARGALTRARTAVHAFGRPLLSEATDAGRESAAHARSRAEAALEEHGSRRIWLAGSLVLIGAVVALLMVFVRRFPADEG